jgi:hypothetical protein
MGCGLHGKQPYGHAGRAVPAGSALPQSAAPFCRQACRLPVPELWPALQTTQVMGHVATPIEGFRSRLPAFMSGLFLLVAAVLVWRGLRSSLDLADDPTKGLMILKMGRLGGCAPVAFGAHPRSGPGSRLQDQLQRPGPRRALAVLIAMAVLFAALSLLAPVRVGQCLGPHAVLLLAAAVWMVIVTGCRIAWRGRPWVTAAIVAAFAVMMLTDSHENMDRLLDQVQATVVTAHQASITNAKLIPKAKQEVTSAEEALRLTQKNLQSGTGLTIDVLQAQDAADQARLRYATALIRYNESQCQPSQAVSPYCNALRKNRQSLHFNAMHRSRKALDKNCQHGLGSS